MAIDRNPWHALVDDDGSNLVGSIWNKAAIATVLLDPIDASLGPLQANWNAIPFTPANFGATGGTWTVSNAEYAYAIIGRTLMLTLSVVASTVGGAPSQLTLWNPVDPGNYQTIGPIKMAVGSGGWETGMAHAVGGQNAIALTRASLLAWPAGATQVYMTMPIART